MYRIRILRNRSNDRVNLQLFASRSRWEPEIFNKLADLMQKYELLKLHIPLGTACFEVEHFPLEYLKDILVDLKMLGFSIKCPVLEKRS